MSKQAKPRRLSGAEAVAKVRTLDDDPRHAGLVQALLQRATDLDVFVKQTPVLGAVGEPTRVPGAVDAEAKPDRIDLLTH